ncbi:MAG TPA: transaldolase [Caulobacteraceae bacterium]|jgi:transaldolase/glucose-6-phosphate isomerase|nr:transaldolase [Caulobacteraceae bacterium]
MTNHLRELRSAGQAAWLDFLESRILENGDLARLISADGVTGLTSNPSIFEKAIGGGDAYDARIGAAVKGGETTPIRVFEHVAVGDIQAAADLFRPTFDALGGKDGFVSLEVAPTLANDTQGTIAEARRLWAAVDRPNLMIKVPGTQAGVPAIRQLIGEGINVNVTLLFGVGAYLDVADAHMSGLETRLASGGDVSKVHGVASFFVSRIDTQIDKKIDARLKADPAPEEEKRLRRIRGRIAIANAKRAYQRYLELIDEPRWKALAAAGASPQRLLWASTGVKDPAYPETLYVDSLIGPDTVNTMPPKTMDAFRRSGRVAPTLTEGVAEAEHDLAEAEGLGLDLDGVTNGLVDEGVQLFAKSFDELLGAVASKSRQLAGAA